jgi:hypothetical protein
MGSLNRFIAYQLLCFFASGLRLAERRPSLPYRTLDGLRI